MAKRPLLKSGRLIGWAAMETLTQNRIRHAPRSLKYVTLFALAPAIVAISLGLYERATWFTDPDNAVFESVCGRCHEPSLAHRFVKSPEEWEATVATCLNRDSAAPTLDPVSRQNILSMLIRHRSSKGDTLFAFRCNRCHNAKVIDDYLSMSRDTIKLMVKRHVRQYNKVVTAWEGELIADYLIEKAERTSQTNPVRQAESQYHFELWCGECHTVSFRYKAMFAQSRDENEWEAVVQRMREKAPDFITAEGLPMILHQISEMAASRRPVP
jgi:cytochrome c5